MQPAGLLLSGRLSHTHRRNARSERQLELRYSQRAPMPSRNLRTDSHCDVGGKLHKLQRGHVQRRARPIRRLSYALPVWVLLPAWQYVCVVPTMPRRDVLEHNRS